MHLKKCQIYFGLKYKIERSFCFCYPFKATKFRSVPFKKHKRTRLLMKYEHLEKFYNPFKCLNPNILFFQDVKKRSVEHIGEHPHNKLLRDLLTNRDTLSVDEIPLETTHQEFLDVYASLREKGFLHNNPILIAIDSQGLPIILDGLHRTVCAIALGIQEVPIQIVYRDLNWQLVKHDLYAQNQGLHMYQKVEHFDLDGWTGWRIDSNKRAELVVNFLQKKIPVTPTNIGNYRGLELACNSGIVTCGIARSGYRMLGLDVDIYCVNTGSSLSKMRQVGAINEVSGENLATFEQCGYVVDLSNYEGFDFIVCFSLLNHHQVDGRDEEGKEIFRRLVEKAPIVFLDCPTEGDPVGGNTDFVRPSTVIKWCESTGVKGKGSVLALYNEHPPLMRSLIVWERD